MMAEARGDPASSTPGEIPEEIPEETPVETPGEIPEETPGEIPEETRVETPGEIPEETPGEIPEETPGEIPEEIPGETPGETPGEFSDAEISTKREFHWRLGPANLDDTLPFDFPDSDCAQIVEESITGLQPECLQFKACHGERPSAVNNMSRALYDNNFLRTLR